MWFSSRPIGRTQRDLACAFLGKMAFFAAVMLLSGLFLAACGGNGSTTTTDPVILKGETVYKRECATCHSTKPGVTIVGPSLDGIATRGASRIAGLEAREYIYLSITKPSEYVVDGFVDQMPANFGTSLSDEEMEGVISYLLTLE